MPLELQPYFPRSSERGPCWNLGNITIDQLSSRQILGEPHYIETDSTRTARGTEDHWTFLTEPQLIIFMKLCAPYDILYLHVVGDRIPSDTWAVIGEIFPGYIQVPLEIPFDEMRHPDDPSFYYVS